MKNMKVWSLIQKFIGGSAKGKDGEHMPAGKRTKRVVILLIVFLCAAALIIGLIKKIFVFLVILLVAIVVFMIAARVKRHKDQ